MDWAAGNKAGREAAVNAIAEARKTEDLPGLVAAIKDAVTAGDARSVGFLYTIAGVTIR